MGAIDNKTVKLANGRFLPNPIRIGNISLHPVFKRLGGLAAIPQHIVNPGALGVVQALERFAGDDPDSLVCA
jgi:hypothetical protein